MRRRLVSVASFSTVLAMALAPACGGATDPHDLLGGGESSGSSSGSGGLDAGHDTATHVGAGDSAASIDSGGGLDSSTGTIDSSSPLPEASPVPEAGGGGVLCPPSTCNPGSVCCATRTGVGKTPTYKCQDATKACGSTTTDPGTPISCAVPADCPGEVCCGENTNGYYSKVSCEATCTGTTATGATEITFCDPNADDCPAGTTCQASQVLSGFSVCN